MSPQADRRTFEEKYDNLRFQDGGRYTLSKGNDCATHFSFGRCFQTEDCAFRAGRMRQKVIVCAL